MRGIGLNNRAIAATIIVASTIAFLTSYALIGPRYPGDFLPLALFIVSSLLFFWVSVIKPASVFSIVISLFLTTGFLVKAVFHFGFGVALIEPTGEFTGEWDTALHFASAGLIGASLAALTVKILPTLKQVARVPRGAERFPVLVPALIALIAIAAAIYVANYQYNILRIGFPLGIPLNSVSYAVLSFIITWGSLLGALALVQWLIEARGWSFFSLIVFASFIGFMASLTMSSRVQFLLYLLAAVIVIIWHWREISGWRPIAGSMAFAIALFAASLVIVSFERHVAYSSAPRTERGIESNSESSQARRNAALILSPEEVRAAHVEGVLGQLKSLVIMRWVGLEGVMTTAGEQKNLGTHLLIEGLTEDPARGKNGIYQHMAGDYYGNVEYFTFLTIPGPVGLASYSGSHLLIGVFLYAILVAGHLVEWVATYLTRNASVAASSGVALAYLTVQMTFPLTLLVFAVELLLAAFAIFVFRKLTIVRQYNTGTIGTE